MLKTSEKTIRVSKDTHSFLILHKHYGGYASVDEFLKDRLKIGKHSEVGINDTI